MPIIYFDKFRGFKETFLPLKEVNFFVGENSTGKTSVLKLLKIISNSSLWMTGELSDNDADLGYFSEITDLTSNSENTFEIGILSDKSDEDNEITAIKLTFESRNKYPKISKICLLTKYINIEAVLNKRLIKYRYNTIIDSNEEIKNIFFFKKWIYDNGLSNNDFETENTEMRTETLPLIFRIQFLISMIEIEKDIKKK